MSEIVVSYRWASRELAVNRVKVAVAVSEEALGQLEDVADACCALGFRHESTLSGIGVLVGSIEYGDLAGLRFVPGVTAVEVEREFPLRSPPA